MTTANQNKSRSTDYGKLNALAQLVCYRLDELLEKLEIDLRRCGRMYMGCCPIHCGDNYSALNLYPEGDRVPGLWRCNTRHCEYIFAPTIIGFTRGILSQKYFQWTSDKPKEGIAPFNDVIKWLCKFVEKDWKDISVDERTVEVNRFAQQVEVFKKTTAATAGVPRSSVRKHLQMPADYYLNRGYRSETLDTFDVGLCTDPNKEMYNRVVVPIYDDKATNAVAFTGRSVFEKCVDCGTYHNREHYCPDKEKRKNFSKWHHVGDTGNYLYNWWNAKRSIEEKAHAVIVEGPGDVWRLHEAGVDNAVAMFGADLTDQQQIILEKSGAMKVTVIRDNDPAGEMCEAKLREQLGRSYRLRFVVPTAKDVGEMTAEQIRKDIIPCLN